ncbi:MAG: biotin/lipoyl-binding protein [Candidatus Wallbacteria bacterium]
MIRKYLVKVGNESFEVEVDEIQKQVQPTSYSNIIMPQVITSPLPTVKPKVDSGVIRQKSQTGGKTINAMMSGSIIGILVKEGDSVKEGDAVIKLEAMKMETVVNSPFTGIVKEVCVKQGQAVSAGEMLVVIEP